MNNKNNGGPVFPEGGNNINSGNWEISGGRCLSICRCHASSEGKMNIHQAVDFLEAQITIQKTIGINDLPTKVNIKVMQTVVDYVKDSERKKSMKKIEDSLCRQ